MISSSFPAWLDTTTLGYVLLHFLWQGILIAAALYLTLRLLEPRDAQRRYLAACTALLLMTALPVGTWFYLNSSTAAPITEATPVALPPDTTTPIATNPAAINTPTDQVTQPAKSIPEPTTQASAPSLSPTLQFELDPLLPYLVLLWLLGVTLLALRLTGSLIITHRLKTHSATLAPAHFQNTLKRYTRHLGLKRPIRLLTSSTAPVPMVIGWLRPVILIPTSAITGLTTQQLETILAHELAHIRRHDYLVNILQHLAETLLFYHPAIWWVSRQVRKEREHCCDDIAVTLANGDTLTYATALAQLESLKQPRGLALAAGDGSLLHRIQRLMGYTPQSTPTPAPWTLGAILTFTVLLTGAILFNPQPAQAQDLCANSYFPIAEGATWRYRNPQQHPDFLMTYTITDVQEATFELIIHDTPSTSTLWHCTEEGLAPSLFDVHAGEYLQRELRRLGAQDAQLVQQTSGVIIPRDEWWFVGSSWEYEHVVAAEIPGETRAQRLFHNRVTHEITAREQVTVPAGVFDAFRVDVRMTNTSYSNGEPTQNSFSAVYWYVEGVGWVKLTETAYTTLGTVFNASTFELAEYSLSNDTSASDGSQGSIESEATASTNHHTIWLTVTPGVTFDEDFTQIASIPPSGYILIEERIGETSRQVRITQGEADSSLLYTYTINRIKERSGDTGRRIQIIGMKSLDERTRAWVEDILQKLVLDHLQEDPRSLSSDLSTATRLLSSDTLGSLIVDTNRSSIADALLHRLPYLDSQSGEASLQDRIRWTINLATHARAHNLVTDAELRHFLEEVHQNFDLEVPTLQEILIAARELGSDEIKASLLVSVASLAREHEVLRSEYQKVASTIQDHELKQQILDVLSQDSADNEASERTITWATVSPSVAFDEDYTRIDRILVPSAYVLIEERTGDANRQVRVTRGADDTTFDYTYIVNGGEQPFTDEARAWYEQALELAVLQPQRDHASNPDREVPAELSSAAARHNPQHFSSFVMAVDAASAVHPLSLHPFEQHTGAQLHRTDSQIDILKASHVRAHDLVSDEQFVRFLEDLVQKFELEDVSYLEVLLAAREIERDELKAEFLLDTSERLSRTPELTAAYIDAAETISSEELRRQALAALQIDGSAQDENSSSERSPEPTEGLGATSRFFRQVFGTRITRGMIDDFYMSMPSSLSEADLTQVEAHQQTPFDIYGPAVLPERLQNPHFRVLPDEPAVMVAYELDEGDRLRVPLAYMQHPADADLPPLPVGRSASIMQIDVGDVIAEVVQGDWVASERDGELRWDARQPTLWVVWQQDGFVFTLMSRDFVINWAALPDVINSFLPLPAAATGSVSEAPADRRDGIEVTHDDAPLSEVISLSPAPGAEVGGFLALRWAPVPAGVTYHLTVTRDDTEEVVHRSSTGGVMAWVGEDEPLEAGVTYSWMVEAVARPGGNTIVRAVSAPRQFSVSEVLPNAQHPGRISGRVVWHNQPVANARVTLQDPPPVHTYPEGMERRCCQLLTTYRTTYTAADGTFEFDNLPRGDYAVVARASTTDFVGAVSRTVPLTMATTFHVGDLALVKPLTVLGPVSGAEHISLTPTLSWQQVPGAVSYNVAVWNAITQERVFFTSTPSVSVTLPELLEPGVTYGWSVTAVARNPLDGVPIAQAVGQRFTTSHH